MGQSYNKLKMTNEELEQQIKALQAERDQLAAQVHESKTITWSARIPATLRDELKALDPSKTVQQITLDALNAYKEAHATPAE